MVFKSLIRSLSVLLVIVAFNSNAAVVYEYTGNNYSLLWTTPSNFDTSMSITGSFTVDSKLIDFNGDITNQVTSYSFSDGITAYTDADPEGSTQFIVNTDSNGNITNWIVDISDVDTLSPNLEPGDIVNRIITQTGDDFTQVYQCYFIVSGSCIFSQIDGAFAVPGSWSVVPVPAAVWLFGSGLLGLIGVARRKKS